ncbi:DUF4125 family protein [Chloroflexota bacterium]
MKEQRGNQEELVNNIIQIERVMFQQVQTSEPSICQERVETFKAMRKMTHSVLSTETLASYLNDLQKAGVKGRNLLRDKYARMQDLIPPLKTNPVIEKICEFETRWMMQLSVRYPGTFQAGSNFRTYLSCELETYSDRTINLYFRDVLKADYKGRNLVEERYAELAKDLGYSSLDHMVEATLQKST